MEPEDGHGREFGGPPQAAAGLPGPGAHDARLAGVTFTEKMGQGEVFAQSFQKLSHLETVSIGATAKFSHLETLKPKQAS